MPTVSLREITADSVLPVCRLDVREEQKGLVAPNAVSIAQAHFEPAAWFRAIYADEELVGFVMLYDPTRTATPEEAGVAYLWRLMIDARHQHRGHGARTLALVIEHVRRLSGVTVLRTSYVDRPGNASALYLAAGFVPTGAIDDGEIVLERVL